MPEVFLRGERDIAKARIEHQSIDPVSGKIGNANPVDGQTIIIDHPGSATDLRRM